MSDTTQSILVQRSVALTDVKVTNDTDRGRTIVARALTYGEPYDVTDDGGASFYTEVWRAGVFDRSIQHRSGKIPLMGVHNRGRWPVGVVRTVENVGGAMIFTARVSNTQEGNDALELLADGALTGVSVGARILRNRAISGGFERVEARLEEISLAPATFTQMPDAAVLAVRAVLAHGEQDDDVETGHMGLPVSTPSLDEARALLAQYTRP